MPHGRYREAAEAARTRLEQQCSDAPSAPAAMPAGPAPAASSDNDLKTARWRAGPQLLLDHDSLGRLVGNCHRRAFRCRRVVFRAAGNPRPTRLPTERRQRGEWRGRRAIRVYKIASTAKKTWRSPLASRAQRCCRRDARLAARSGQANAARAQRARVRCARLGRRLLHADLLAQLSPQPGQGSRFKVRPERSARRTTCWRSAARRRRWGAPRRRYSWN